MDARALWDVLSAVSADGHTYTTLRHIQHGTAVELWHESKGHFHAFALEETTLGKVGAVYCCFSSGMVVPEDSLCAPEALLDLVENGSAPPPDLLVGGEDGPRDEDFVIPPGGLRAKSRSGEVTWDITPRGRCTVLGGRAEGCIVIRHATAATEIILTQHGFLFAPSAKTSLLLPRAALQEQPLFPSRGGPADPCRLAENDSSE